MNPLLNRMSMPSTANPSQDTPTQHGFFMLGSGSQTIFFYHSAQFTMEDHSYQMIFTVDIPAEALDAYTQDVEKQPAGQFVWVFANGIGNPPPADQLFTLPQIQIGAVTSLTGSIFRVPAQPNGTGGGTVVPDVTVTVERLVYFRHFDYSQPYPDPLPYILFGDQTGAYVAHFLTKLKDFDNLAVLSGPPAWLDLQQLMAGCPIDFTTVSYTPGQLPSSSPLAAGTTYSVEFGGISDSSFTVQVQSIYWFDVSVVNAPAS